MLHKAPLATMAAALRSGDLNLLEHTRATLERLESLEPQLQAFVPEPGRRERVLRAAEALLERWPQQEARPPLFGVPLGVKDIFRVNGLPTLAGSKLPAALFEGAQADCVSRLLEAGVLVLGKTVTTEFAYFEPGPTRNPHNLAHTPGGSSSGSAAAVAAGICPLALGTQTIGSLVRPAAFCGVAGFKPGYGRIDATGVIYVAPTLDHVGIFAQHVAGLRIAASLLCKDWRQPSLSRRPRLGVVEGPLLERLEAEGRAGFEGQIARLQTAGFELQRIELFDEFDEMDRLHRALMACEMAQEHRTWFAEYEALYRPRTAGLIRAGQRVAVATAQQARVSRMQTRRMLQERMEADGIDLWLSPPATGPAPAGIASTGDPVMNLPWTHAGLPTVSLPAGRAANGMPLGLQVSSRHGEDELLLAWSEKLAALLAE